MRLGPYEVVALEDGFFALDGGAMFGVVPRTIWQKAHPPDERNRIRLALRTLLVRGLGRTLLVDTGIGAKFPDKYRDIYGIDHAQGTLLDRLAQRGIAPADVTDVVVTHLHFDHAGGATTQDPDGRLHPTFPDARIFIQRANWDWASNPNDREKASYLRENFQPLAEAGRVTLLDGPCELYPGLSVLVSDGHTRGQQMVRVDAGGRTVLYPGDLIPTSSHLRTAWTMAYDIEPLRVMEEKKRLLAEAARDGWIVCFEHDPLQTRLLWNILGPTSTTRASPRARSRSTPRASPSASPST
jgi:glyoxylase-like metal-dependent hydrolase (beta-lactamase superfamily II)